jgi:hypothetical protein
LGFVLASYSAARPETAVIGYPTPTLISSEGDPRAVAVGLLDGDLNVDLVTASTVGGQILIHRGRGNGNFVSTIRIQVGGSPAEITLADLDLNGRLDVVWADERTGAIGVLYQSSSVPVSYEQRIIPGPDEAVSVHTADLDADGWLDVVVAHRGADQISILFNPGGVLQPPRLIDVGDAPVLVRLAPRPMPEPDHLIVVQSGVLSRDVATYAASDLAPLQRIDLQQPTFAAITSWDTDDFLDLALLDGGAGQVQIQIGSPGGEYVSSAQWSCAPGSRALGVLEELPGARRFMVLETARRRIRFFGEENGTIQPGRSYFTGAEVERFSWGDLDHDGIDELIVPIPGIDALQIMPQLGDGLLALETKDSGKLPETMKIVADGSEVWLNVLCTTSNDVWRYRLEQNDVLFRERITVHPAGSRQAWGDLNGDGFLDLCIMVPSIGFEVHRGLPNGGFTTPSTVPVAGDLRSLDVVELVGGGPPDVVIGVATPPELRVYRGALDASFPLDRVIPLSDVPVTIAHRDLDVNGFDDLAVVGEGSLLYLIFQTSEGELGSTLSFIVGEEPRDVGFGRFNADPYPDIVVANAGSSSYSVLNTILPGIYTPSVQSQLTPSGAQKVIVSDVDANGFDDIIFSSPSSEYLAIHLNTGTEQNPTGTFSIPTRLRASTLALDTDAFDLDGDLREELLVLDSLGDLVVLVRSDPYSVLPPLQMSAQARWERAQVVIDIRGSANATSEFVLTRERDGLHLNASRVGVDVWEAIDADPSSAGETYILRDQRGEELARAGLSARGPATASLGADRPLLLDPREEAGVTRIRFRLPRAESFSLRIFDVRGRLVARPGANSEGGGWYAAAWLGEDFRGRPTARGRYLVEVRTATERLTAAFLRR